METRFDWWMLWVIIYLAWGAGYAILSRNMLQENGEEEGWLPIYYYVILAVIWPIFIPLDLYLLLDRLWHKALFGIARLAARIVRFADDVATKEVNRER